MPTYQFEAMDPQGQEIRDVIEAPTQDEAQATIRSMGYFVTKISVIDRQQGEMLLSEMGLAGSRGSGQDQYGNQ